MLEVGAERHLGALGDERGRSLEARVGVDAAPSRLRDRRRVVGRQAGRVSEQVAEGRTRRPRGFIELERAFVHGAHAGAGEPVALDRYAGVRQRDGGHLLSVYLEGGDAPGSGRDATG